MRRLIVNADDLGHSDAVNAAIFALMASGHVTSASLMMNAPAVEAAVREIARFPGRSFGVHLNATDFPPLCRDAGLAVLCDGTGSLHTEWARGRRHLPRRARQAVFAEWCAQVERALALGVPVSHLDSHHHLHTHPSLFLVLKRVQRRFGIRRVRLARNLFAAGEHVRPGFAAGTAAWNLALRTIYRTRTADAFTAFRTFHERAQNERTRAGLSWQGTLELMCHPGGEMFAAETRLLASDWRETLAGGAELISYHEV
ncbi:ChbG/HpnK family deacetylase [Blastochloris tepida]|uniref:Carbohydrate deacetylase n=1 Tax=Blastochloris tepida TaxID=2233851 RepID=A0A348FZ88_9HYPH|nr:ChbG/HpnK family deacetylase [Blastochloris tepida]BBF92621.1 carbohydrate deacetylase [Blastochloris tepida]